MECECLECGTRAEMKPHNYAFECSTGRHYKCDGCLLLKAKKAILDGLKSVLHDISIEELLSLAGKKGLM